MSESMKGLKRTDYCGVLRETDIGKTVVLMGWVQRRRDLGGVIFVELRDQSGISQIVFDGNKLSKDDFTKAEKIRSEYVIAVKGTVELRDEETINEALKTGTIDVRASELRLLSEAKTPPFLIEDDVRVKEETRLKYRYLDLRRPVMLERLKMRQEVINASRLFLTHNMFTEIETPILTKSTPEGARDYLVPSRVNQGKFYALPQSPQIYKQLLMASGVDRYFQVARCFRDEDLRADRQPEFTQVDMELSFESQEDIIVLLEELFADIISKVTHKSVSLPFERMTYKEAMNRYGTDKPDIRFGYEMQDITDIAKDCSFQVFRNVADQGGIVKAINVKSGDRLTRTNIEDLTKKAISYGSKGMAWIALDQDGSLKSVLTKYFKVEELKAIMDKTQAKPGDLIIFCADKEENVYKILGNIRLDVAVLMGVINQDEFKFLVVTDFPLLEWSKEEKRYIAMHHPFTMPREEDMELIKTKPEAIRAQSYDIVLNGVELGSGSIRIHQHEIQEKIFELLGFSSEEIKERFGFMIDAFQYGTPPHGGFAFGLDRLVMLLSKSSSIREVIAFPKTKDGSCQMMQTPSFVSSEQLEELEISIGGQMEEKRTDEKRVSKEVIEYVADLSRINLAEEEKETLTKDLQDIIEFANQLESVNVEGIEATAHLMGVENAFREDIVTNSEMREALLENAPTKKEGCFYVPKIVE